MSRTKKGVLERLLERAVVLPNGCIIWLGSDSGNGYGRISVKGKTRATHIVAYELTTGRKVPKGMVLDHKCGNRLCFNVECLKPIPGVVNTLIGNGPTAINALKTHCLRGHELAGDNLITRVRNGRQSRECRACRRLRTAA